MANMDADFADVAIMGNGHPDDNEISIKEDYVAIKQDPATIDFPADDDQPDEQQQEDEKPISEEDAWTVISSHFGERGLVGQQLDSFDVFMTNTMQVRSCRCVCVVCLSPFQPIPIV